MAGCFGTSAVYHRPTWTPAVRVRLARLDRAVIYLLIAGTYTPLIVMSSEWAVPVLSVVCGGALAAISVKVFWLGAPKWLCAAIAVALGWSGCVLRPVRRAGRGLMLPVAGGILYTAGAVV